MAVHLVRIEGWTTMGAPHPRGWGDARQPRKLWFPLMTQLTMRSGAADRVNDGGGSPTKKFDTQRIPKLQPLVDKPGADESSGPGRASGCHVNSGRN
jgi:hypothetical protein